jgi:hypothetical protein
MGPIMMNRDNVEAGNRPVDSFEQELANRLGVGRRLDGRMHFAVDEDLSAARFAAQPRRDMHYRADRSVVVSTIEADAAERRIAVGDVHAEAESRGRICAIRRSNRQLRPAFRVPSGPPAAKDRDKAAGQ